ncbi:MAG: DNA repair protein RecO [Drouetiella hepatica Uher 2000/2452]|jgi:DNA repair protein RecO (recombination protein O)|uniref:DNA repair protein RecO n=1 Tax=Drouetiella hepatica Uher 2000/2452 TaxID=904376 RepID=A0A951UKW8_9CYAN|nr:DNA repair protein RecO [Drouetiella hepatica Uher 2000/2452]
MSGTYKALGINLKSAPLGESDRLLTILTEEFGLIRAVAPGSRKHKSSLGGRSSLFVVNHLLVARGKNLDKITQAESQESYPGLSQDLGKLTAGQYLAELALMQAMDDHPQPELFCLLREHLSRLEKMPSATTLPCLVQAIYHLLALAGLPPQVQTCCVTQQPITPNFADPDWRVGFSIFAGGTFLLSAIDRLKAEHLVPKVTGQVPKQTFGNPKVLPSSPKLSRPADLYVEIGAIELDILQQLSQPNLIQDWFSSHSSKMPTVSRIWLSLERILRQYAQYHYDRPIRSATLIDACFADAPPACDP